ncbi:DpnII family type II restriction endonuclease, partial [Metamycoplasma hyosynoviae]
MTRNFKKWLKTMKSSIANWTYYTDFEKVYKNVQKIKVELNILNSLIGSKQIEKDFIELINKYPNVLNVIPILLAKREQEILVNIPKKEYIFDFYNVNCSIEEYVLFMKNSGLFNL